MSVMKHLVEPFAKDLAWKDLTEAAKEKYLKKAKQAYGLTTRGRKKREQTPTP